ncbi:phage tail protein [uncultured Akkermansia sp.]|uniref:phage tail-collar fiber domain-containing protein n=1 Tax=uncultured Akkermansia sp. TaxID=512294 RepID=UPI00260AC43C|nr:phage tail protein [uncultured Akkermansia sp.]
MVITTAGLELLQDLILEGGTPLTFSGVGVGDGLLEDSDITAKTSLVHEVHRLPIEKIEKQEGGHIRVFARLATDIITTDFYHRELGVFTRYGEQEILFAYGNAGDDYDFIPATGNNASICKTIVTEFTVGSMKAVFLPLDSKDFVTHEAMNAQVEEVITRETRKVLEAIPQVDAAGNMTLAGGLTAAGAVNANGGVNIPLAVGAPTDTGAVNRLHAAGMAGVTDIFSQHAYLNTGSITATGTAATTVLIPGQYAQVRVPAGTHSTIVFPFTGPNGQHNYSNFAGFSIPWRIPGAGKITIGIGRGSKTTRSDLTQGSYSIIPGNNLAHNSGEILDITFDNVRDATRGGYVVKVREIYALSEAEGWRVKTTTSFVPATHNEPIPSIVNKIIYHQRTQYKFESEYISYGSLYLLTGGGQTVQLHKIAAVRGVNAFETGLGISSIVTDLPGTASGDVYMQVGSAVRTLYQPGNINPVYYALEALARNDIEAEETADFVDINIPL